MKNGILGGVLLRDHSMQLFRRRHEVWSFESLPELRKQLETIPELGQYDLEDFRRGSSQVKIALLSALLVSRDSGIYDHACTGVIGWNGARCAAQCLDYFADYAAHGRETGRGGLFVGTLNSIPVCEAAIALGAHGGGLYLDGSADELTSCMKSLLLGGSVERLMLMEIEEDNCAALLVNVDFCSTGLKNNNLKQYFI